MEALEETLEGRSFQYPSNSFSKWNEMNLLNIFPTPPCYDWNFNFFKWHPVSKTLIKSVSET